MQIKYIFHTLLAGLLILSACQMQTPSTTGIKTNTASLSQPNQRAFNQHKGPYTGPVSIKINTGLMQQSTGKVVEIKSQGNFKIQAVPQGPVIFSETLQIQHPNQDFTRLFKVPNTGKRYIVHVAKQEPQPGRDSRVQVNLNGAWVIREKDFERGEEEFQTTGLLLNANNSLKIRFKGKTGSRLTLTVVEAGEAGTLLRRRGWEKDKDLTQADRVSNNDTNIFYPNQPDSLGGLQPYEGDELLNTDNPNSSQIGVSTANGSAATIFVGEFYITLAEPVEENLQYLLANYPLELGHRYTLGGYTEVIFKIKMAQASLQSLPETIAALNLRPDFPPLKEVVFSSVNTAKTVAVLSEILAHESERLVFIGLQNKAEKHFQNSNGKIVTEEENRSAIYSPAGFTLPVKSSDLWWLEKTKANQAWRYGMGHGVKIAVIDDQFGLMDTNKEFEHRAQEKSFLTINGYDDQFLFPPNSPGDESRLQNPPGHGLWVSNILGAGKNNELGVIGAAPQTTIIPLSTGNKIDTNLPVQLEKIANSSIGIDIVNISQGRLINFFDYWARRVSTSRDTDLILKLRVLFDQLNQKNVIVVTSAGNSNQENTVTSANLPSTLSVDTPNVISVGAYDVNNQRAFFNEPPLDIASNFGPPGVITIWAPGKDLWALHKVFDNNKYKYQDSFKSIKGTSFAAPQVAATLALLKSWKKNLTGAEAKLILRDTSMSITEPSGTPSDLSFYPPSTVKPVTMQGLDALAAVTHPSIQAKEYTKYCAIMLSDVVSTGQLLFGTQHLTTQPDIRKDPLYPSFSPGDTIAVWGWKNSDKPNLANGTIEAIHFEKDNNCSSGGFNTKIFFSPPPGTTPESAGVNAFYNPNSTTPITARAGDLIGFYTANARTRNISIEIQGQNAVLTAVDDNLLTMTVPANLLIGNLDVLFKSDEGEFKIENLINYTSPFPEVVKFSKPTIFANGGDVVDAYITVKDANGQPAPDGTPYYVQLVPTQLGLYPDLTMIHPETGQQYGGRWTTVEQVLPVKNGKIHIQAKLTAPIAPYEYTYDFSNSLPNVFTWPHANAPSFQVQVCNPAYSSSKPGYGYYCGQQLFPQAGNTLDGRLYAVHAYSFDPQIQHVTAGSPKRTITIRNVKDILGNPVPVGTHLHFNQTYYGTVSNPNGNDIYWGVAVTTPGEVDIVYEPFQRITCGLVGVEEYVYITTVQGAVGNPLHWLVGNPIYFRYVAC